MNEWKCSREKGRERDGSRGRWIFKLSEFAGMQAVRAVQVPWFQDFVAAQARHPRMPTTRRFSPPLLAVPVMPVFSTPVHLAVCDPPNLAHCYWPIPVVVSALAATDRPSLLFPGHHSMSKLYCCCRSLLRQRHMLTQNCLHPSSRPRWPVELNVRSLRNDLKKRRQEK